MMANKKRKVAIIAFGMEHCNRGVETHARMLFERLHKESGMDVFLIKGSGKSSAHEIVLSVPKRHTWLNRFLGKIRGYNIYWEQVWFLFRLGFHLLRNRYDVLYTQEYVHMVGVGKMRKLLAPGMRIVYCEGFISTHGTRLKYADILQEVNKDNYKVLAPLAKECGKEIKLIPHFFDPRWESPDEGWEKLKEQVIEFKVDRKMILYVGPTELREKNFHVLEQAFHKLGSDWCLLICGEVPQACRTSLDPSGDRLKVLCLTHSLMQVIYPLADVFILPSLDEPFGIATIEALSHGLPVLLHDTEHSLWLCNDPNQCIDMREAANILSKLQDKTFVEESFEQISFKNQQYFLKTFTWEHLKKDYLQLFAE